jgi:hypothetical protein
MEAGRKVFYSVERVHRKAPSLKKTALQRC